MMPTLFLLFGSILLGTGILLSWRGVSNLGRLPLALFCITFSMLGFLLPSVTLYGRWFRHQSQYHDSALALTLAFQILFAFSTIVAYAVASNGLHISQPPRQIRPASNLEVTLLTLVCLVPALLGFLSLLEIVTDEGWSAYLANRIAINRGSGYRVAVLSWPLVMLTVYLPHVKARGTDGSIGRRLLRWGVVLVLTATTVGFAAVRGSRTDLVLPLIITVWVLMVMHRRTLTVPLAIPMIVIGVVVAIGLGDVRQRLMTGVRPPTSELFPDTRDIVQNFSETENLLWLIEHREALSFYGGETFFAAAGGWIPRRIWPEKPLGAGPRLRNTIHPGSYSVTRNALTSFTPGLPAEAFMNFSWLGAPLVGILYGLVLSLLHRAWRRIRGPLGLAAWLLVVFVCLLSLRGEFFGSVARAFILLTPIVAVVLLKSLLRPRLTAVPSDDVILRYSS